MNSRDLRSVPVAIILGVCACGMLSCSMSTGPVDDDGTAPSPVFDLAVSAASDTSVTLTWTATGDDEQEGTATRYELRRSDNYIAPPNWDEAVPMPGLPAPQPAGATEVFTVTGLAPDSHHFFALSVFDEEGNTGGCGNCVEAECFEDVEVAVPDTNLAEAIRERLSLSPGPLHRSDLRSIVDLDAYERDIVELAGLEECRNLAFLHLHGNRISDLTPIAGLTQLFDLSIAINEIVSVSPLAGLNGLAHLWADDNLIADLSPLAGLQQLTWLRIERNEFNDISPLAGLSGMEALGLGDNPITDVTPLTGLTSLQTLTMNTCGLSSLDFVAGMSQLQVLHVGNNQLTDIEPLAGLLHLEFLQISYNQITDLTPLVTNPGLGTGDTVFVRWNPLSATAINEQIPALVERGVNVVYLD